MRCLVQSETRQDQARGLPGYGSACSHLTQRPARPKAVPSHGKQRPSLCHSWTAPEGQELLRHQQAVDTIKIVGIALPRSSRCPPHTAHTRFTAGCSEGFCVCIVKAIEDECCCFATANASLVSLPLYLQGLLCSVKGSAPFARLQYSVSMVL